jgi:hypothetical protein
MAQWLAQDSYKVKVPGSSPGWCTLSFILKRKNMSQFEFACSFFGYDNIVSNRVSKQTIDRAYDDWKHSLMSFNDWKRSLNN